MFLTVLHMRYLKAMAEYALLFLLVGVGIFAWITRNVGFTYYLVPALVLPIGETALRFRWPGLLTEKMALVAALVAAISHAVFLWLAQSGTAEMDRFTVICQYLSLVVAGTGLGCMLLTKEILADKEPKRSKAVGKGKGGFQRPRKGAAKKPLK